MPTAKIINFPRSARRRPVTPLATKSHATRRSSRSDTGFGLLLIVTLLASWFYLTGVVHLARHDALYTLLLVAVWNAYILYPSLLRIPVLGPLLAWAVQFLVIAGIVGFFGGIYRLIWSH
jgi:hypothetical protein